MVEPLGTSKGSLLLTTVKEAVLLIMFYAVKSLCQTSYICKCKLLPKPYQTTANYHLILKYTSVKIVTVKTVKE